MPTTVLDDELSEIDAARDGRTPARRSRDDHEPPIRFASSDDLANAARQDLCGLALSGGGIRSATFNLGVIQALADLGLLSRVDYLSTVSGGGYIGAWLAAWIARTTGKNGVEEVQARLKAAVPASQGTAATPMSAYHEQPAIAALRENSNYLTPRLGLFGADTWSAISTYLRNLVLNLTILIVALLPLVLLPRALFALFQGLSKFWAVDALALVSLLFAAVMSGANLRYLRKGVAPVSAKRSAWNTWYLHQRVVLWTIVLPAASGALFVAAALLNSDEVELHVLNGLSTPAWTGWSWWLGPPEWLRVPACLVPPEWLTVPAFLRFTMPESISGLGYLVGGYLFLWIVLILVWKPYESAGAVTTRSHTSFMAILAIVWTILAALLAAVMIRRLADSALVASAATWMTVGLPTVIGVFSASVVLHLGLMGRMVEEEVREWWSRLGGWLLIASSVWMALCGLSLFGPLLVDMAEARIRIPAIGVWLATTGFGVLSGRSPATNGRESGSFVGPIAAIAPYVFIVGLFLMLAAFTDWGLSQIPGLVSIADGNPSLDTCYHWKQIAAVPACYTFLAACGCGVLAWVFSRRVDVNAFSLQPFYRNRLVRCYLGASNEDRDPYPFTGFDPHDDIPLAKLATKERALRPYPLINVALNLVRGEKLAWQERKAASFTLAPLHCGFDNAYRPTAEYAAGRLTLGQAIATSGAAASPNMGYHSNPALAFLMTVFNVRLGMWLGNPKLDSKCWTKAGPKFGLFALLSEMFGNTSESSSYVYLSDGGHFDNLGIYELLRRRCRFIIACDAGADPDVRFDDLGAVIRKCRTDFGIDIDLDTTSLQRDPKTGRCLYYCAVGTVLYRKDTAEQEETHGTLLYLKASLTGDEPVDVLNYAAADASFPHQSTADQWFSESQFESYRRLGFHCSKTVFEAAAKCTGPDAPLEGIFTSLRERWYPPAPTTERFTRHTAKLDALHERLRSNPRMSFLDAQIFPSWPELMAGTTSKPRTELWLPQDPDARRDGFYFCTALIQLMENVYTDLNLGTQFDHPDHRGWMNLFRHWSWCGMLRVTWSVAAATYGARFQTFCRERLQLDIGEVCVVTSTPANLNPVEQGLVAKKTSATRRLYAVALRVADPMDMAKEIDFTVGFALVDGRRLAYLRIQDHLRKMGLGRSALLAMYNVGLVDDLLEVDTTRSEQERTQGQAMLRRLFDSVVAEVDGQRGRGSRNSTSDARTPVAP